jgi:Vault protein inter-alpha-trypsin domain
MSMTAPQPQTIDPLHAIMAGGFVSGTKHPIPLVTTRFDVNLNHGLAIVSATRTFRNAEESSIEATITFPMPVHAVLFNLETRIEGRVLKARAQRKSQARDTYEDAIERGKTTVLHEEVLRSICCRSGPYPPVLRSRCRQPGQ